LPLRYGVSLKCLIQNHDPEAASEAFGQIAGEREVGSKILASWGTPLAQVSTRSTQGGKSTMAGGGGGGNISVFTFMGGMRPDVDSVVSVAPGAGALARMQAVQRKAHQRKRAVLVGCCVCFVVAVVLAICGVVAAMVYHNIPVSWVARGRVSPPPKYRVIAEGHVAQLELDHGVAHGSLPLCGLLI